jgi:hypothetical protein
MSISFYWIGRPSDWIRKSLHPQRATSRNHRASVNQVHPKNKTIPPGLSRPQHTPAKRVPQLDAARRQHRSSYNALTRAGFPANQLVLGLPSYGYISQSTASYLHNRALPAAPVNSTNPDQDNPSAPSSPFVSVRSPDDSSQIQFRDLQAQGMLVRGGPDYYGPSFVGSGGFMQLWDACYEDLGYPETWAKTTRARAVLMLSVCFCK